MNPRPAHAGGTHATQETVQIPAAVISEARATVAPLESDVDN